MSSIYGYIHGISVRGAVEQQRVRERRRRVHGRRGGPVRKGGEGGVTKPL